MAMLDKKNDCMLFNSFKQSIESSVLRVKHAAVHSFGTKQIWTIKLP